MSEGVSSTVSWFGVSNGRATGVIGLVAAAVILVAGVAHASTVAIVAGLLVALLTWVVLLRPRVGTRGTDLVLRGTVSTVVVPLASVQSVSVRQVLAISTGERRYVSASVGNTFREINRQRRGGAGSLESVPGGERKYADQVGDIISERSREARRDGFPGGPVRREWAYLEIGALAVLAVVLVVALALHLGT
jgi:hypothetical protein